MQYVVDNSCERLKNTFLTIGLHEPDLKNPVGIWISFFFDFGIA